MYDEHMLLVPILRLSLPPKFKDGHQVLMLVAGL
jgi:hypothetical protein